MAAQVFYMPYDERFVLVDKNDALQAGLISPPTAVPKCGGPYGMGPLDRPAVLPEVSRDIDPEIDRHRPGRVAEPIEPRTGRTEWAGPMDYEMPRRGVVSKSPTFDGLFVVDLRSLKLDDDKSATIENAIQEAVLAALAALDLAPVKRGFDNGRIGGGQVMGFRGVG